MQFMLFRPLDPALVRGATVAALAGLALPLALPPLHMAVLSKYWSKYARKVDKFTCTCSCWDTIFKGTYETGVASYKHFYFNATRNVLLIWMLTVLAIVALYEAIKRMAVLAVNGRLRFPMALLFLTALFPHYYSWWSYLNYWNDDFYTQWHHQLYFTVSEVGASYAVLRLADREVNVTSRGVLPIVAVGMVHAFLAARDQFVENVLAARGLAHQVVRDVALMVPDLLHILVPLACLMAARPTPSRRFWIELTACVAAGLTTFRLLCDE
ncbi:Hypothetical predicted protein [Cloeon dipterum]|uniref:Uncharacterized protein n=1 Tax=Cloeon dipterum TaxID=197152 RepID=A0A8S1CD94_9INSE|nr:Hypothetical predicted protein [Cloeon dipterum]